MDEDNLTPKHEFKTIHQEALEESEKVKPSGEPAYWAKRSCNRCYGRGIVGTITTTLGKNNKMVNQYVCECAQNRYQRWQDNFVDLFIEERKSLTNQEKMTNETAE